MLSLGREPTAAPAATLSMARCICMSVAWLFKGVAMLLAIARVRGVHTPVEQPSNQLGRRTYDWECTKKFEFDLVAQRHRLIAFCLVRCSPLGQSPEPVATLLRQAREPRREHKFRELLIRRPRPMRQVVAGADRQGGAVMRSHSLAGLRVMVGFCEWASASS